MHLDLYDDPCSSIQIKKKIGFIDLFFVFRLDTDQRSRVSTERRQLNGGLNYATKVQSIFL